MTTMHLRLGLSGPDLPAILEALERTGAFGEGAPTFVMVDNKKRPPTPDWRARWVPKLRVELFVSWDERRDRFLAYTAPRIVKGGAPDFPRDVPRVLALLAEVPFEVASFRSLHESWYRGEGYDGWGFGDLHYTHGWACAFRGAGHDRLVSRRWLEHGPWQLHRGADDVSLVQFHELDADAGTALAQARPGHERMGISDVGGYVAPDHELAHDLDGLYLAERRQLRIVVHGREVSQREMLDACAARRAQALGPEQPLESIAYVFMQEAAARAQLHELWLRELECWTIVDGREVRLDADHAPAPRPPAWAEP